MRRPVRVARWALVLVVLAGAPAAVRSDTVRCAGPDGAVLLTNDPSRCRGPVTSRIAPAPVAPDAPAPPEVPLAPAAPEFERVYHGGLAALFVDARGFGRDWEAVREAPSDVSRDPALRSAGVRAIDARHYTRDHGGVAEVCSVEIWAFVDADRAQRAADSMEHPGWRNQRVGNLWVRIHGTSFRRGAGFRPGLPRSCGDVEQRSNARAAEAVEASPAQPGRASDRPGAE